MERTVPRCASLPGRCFSAEEGFDGERRDTRTASPSVSLLADGSGAAQTVKGGHSGAVKPAHIVDSGLPSACAQCGGRVRLGGPVYSGKLHVHPPCASPMCISKLHVHPPPPHTSLGCFELITMLWLHTALPFLRPHRCYLFPAKVWCACGAARLWDFTLHRLVTAKQDHMRFCWDGGLFTQERPAILYESRNSVRVHLVCRRPIAPSIRRESHF